ncbi:MAG: TolC family protein, partial [Rhizobacter sp.]
MKSTVRRLSALIAAASLAACASAPSEPSAPEAQWPPQWQAPLPHEGQLTVMSAWWRQFNDPLLVDLIGAAQSVSPSVASAASRIEQARATRVAAGAALLPSLDADASAVRGKQDFITGMATTYSAGVQASWELDLFGGRRAARDAAQARAEGATAAWHDARVSVAAEV